MPDNNRTNFGSDCGTVTAISVLRTIPMILVSIASFIGNSLVLLAIYRVKNLRTFSNMFIGSLAVTDIAASLVMPFSFITVLTNGRWLFGHAWCIINGFLLTFIASVSMLTLLAFSMYRCYLITTIQKRLSAVFLGRMVKASVVGIWLFGFVFASPPLFGGGEIKFSATHYSCLLDFTSSEHYAEFLFVVVFSVPLVVMSIAYIRIAKFIMMHNKTIKKNSGNTRRTSGVFSPSQSEASVDEGNRYTVMELKRKVDLMSEGNEAQQQMLQNQLNAVLLQARNQKTSEKSESEEIPLKNLQPSTTTEENFKQNSNETSEQSAVTSNPLQDDPSSSDTTSEAKSNSSETTSDKKRSERFKKISVSSIVQKWKNRVNKQDFLSQYRRRVSHQARLARVLLATVVTFVVCWAPFAFDSVLLGAGYTKERPKDFQLVSHWLAFTNALCNPIIYTMLNARFKLAFKAIVEEFWRKLCVCKQEEDEVFETNNV